MHTLRVDTYQIRLPDQVAKKLIGKVIQFIEVRDGFMMKTVTDSIKEARGILKDTQVSTERYFQFKEEDKALER